MAILKDDVRPATRRRLLMPAIGVALFTMSMAAAQLDLTPASPASAAPAPATPASGVLAPVIRTFRRASTPNLTGIAVPAALAQAAPGSDAMCWSDLSGGSSFSGTISTSRTGSRTILNEQIGRRGADRVIQQRFGDLRVCMLAEGVGDGGTADRPSQWLARARHIVMEARRGSVVQQLDVERQAGGVPRTTWKVGAAPRAFDAAAQQWRDRMLAALDTSWELSTLRGEVSSLRGEISSIRGHESSLRGEISSLRGQVSSMRGRASSIRGEESSLRGQISSIQGNVSSMRGQISSEHGSISSLNARSDRADDSERGRLAASIAQHNVEIARLEQRIREYDAAAKIAAVERQIKALDADGAVAAIDTEIRAFDVDGKVAAVERQIAGLDVEGKVAAIERQIAALDADRRGRQLEDRRDSELKQLDAAMAAIR